jgi:hypothetical protein
MKPTTSKLTSEVNPGNSFYTQQQKVQVIRKTEIEDVDDDVEHLCLRATSPRRSPQNHASPSGSLNKRQTRSSRLNLNSGNNINNANDNSVPRTTTECIPRSAGVESMNRKLDFNSIESERKMAAARLALDAPHFNLDTPSDEEIFVEDEDDQGVKVHAANNDRSKENAGPSGDSITPVAREYENRILKVGKYER